MKNRRDFKIVRTFSIVLRLGICLKIRAWKIFSTEGLNLVTSLDQQSQQVQKLDRFLQCKNEWVHRFFADSTLQKYRENTEGKRKIPILFQRTWVFATKIKFSNPYIVATWWCKHLIFQTSNIRFNRIHSLKYLRSTTLGC